MNTSKKKALMLGAKSEIAQALSYCLAEEGYNLLLASRNSHVLEPLKKDLELAYSIEVNLVDFDAEHTKNHPDQWANWNEDELISLVVCALGYLGDNEKALIEYPEAQTIMRSNYLGCVSILNLVAVQFRKQKHGCIVGISSVAGDRGRGSNFFYGSAKAGFTAYLSGLRNLLNKEGVHVLTVKPGFVATRMTEGLDLNPRLTSQPEEIAKAIMKAIKRRKNVLYFKPIWRLIMFIIVSLPERIFKKTSL